MAKYSYTGEDKRLKYLFDHLNENVKEYEYRNDFPVTGEVDTIYIADDENKIYRWDGSNYVEIGGGDTNTTYTFEGGINGFTVTPSDTQTPQTVSVTPEIQDNITGSGTTGKLAKFSGANAIEDGPAIGSGTTTYLRNDGQWSTPPGTYELPEATSQALGGIKVGYTQNNRNYPVQLDSQKAFVNVPWVNTTYTFANGANGGFTVSDGTNTNTYMENVPNVTTDNQTPTVEQASTRINLASGDTLKTIIGKIKKWFSDLKAVAFSGSYNDLSDQPTIPTVGDGTITITQNGTTIGDFSMNQSSDETLALTDEKVKITITDPASLSTYYPAWSSDGSSGNKGLNINSGYTYQSRQGTTESDGVGLIQLGNSVPSGTAGNKKGYARIYNKNSYYASVVYNDSATSNTTHTLPVTGGTLINTGTFRSQATVTTAENGLMTATDKVALDSIGETVDTDTTSLEGNPLNFTTKSAQYAQDCNIEMNPIQDTHGYGKPWVGGTGKNKLRMTVAEVKAVNTNGTWTGNALAQNGITYTLITDSDGYCIGAKARGKATSDAYLAFPFSEPSVPAGDYYYSGCPSGGSNSTYDLFGWDRDTNARAKQWDGTTNVVSDYGNGNSQIKVVSGGRYLLRFRMKANYDSSSADVIMYPMLRLSTETDNTWQPYENICPIYPYSGLSFEGVGKNLYIGSPSFDGYVNRSSWSLADEKYNGHEVIYKGYSGGSVYKSIPLKAGVTYTFSAMLKASASDTLYYIYKDSGAFISVGYVGTEWKKIKATFTAETDFESSLRITSGSPDSTIYISEFQLEIASDATDYEPYESTTIPISFGSIAPYGGTLDVRTGKLTVDRGIVDIGNLTWTYMSANAYFTSQITGKAHNQNNICTCYSLDKSSVATMADGTFKGSINNDYVYVKDLRYTDANTFKTALTGQKIVYELAEPQTYYLSPHEVSVLLGMNNISIYALNDTQSIKDTAYCFFNDLVYHNGVMASLADVMSAVEIADKQNAWKYFTTHHANTMTPLDVDSWEEYKFVAYIPYNDDLYYLTASIERNSILAIPQGYISIISVGFTACDGVEMKMWINTSGGVDNMVITGESPNYDILIYYR